MSGTSSSQIPGGFREEEEEQTFSQAQAIVKYNPVMALAPMGTRKVVREMAVRIHTMAPGGLKMTPAECVVLAQYAISLEANPLVGEVWLMKSTDGTVLGLAPGIRLFRRKADEQDEKRGDLRNVELYSLSPEERKDYLVPEGALAYKAVLRSQLKSHSYTEDCERMNKIKGITWDDIRKALGDRPYVEGIGILTAEEMKQLDKSSRNKMPHIERVKKRAEAAALKVVYHLDFGFVPLLPGAIEMSSTLADDFIDVKASLFKDPDAQPDLNSAGNQPAVADQPAATPAAGATPPPPPEEPPSGLSPEDEAFITGADRVKAMMDATEGASAPNALGETEEERTVALQRAGAALFQGDDGKPVGKPKPRKWEKEAKDFVMREGHLKAIKHAEAVLELSPFPVDVSLLELGRWYELYRKFRAEGDKPPLAAERAKAEYDRS